MRREYQGFWQQGFTLVEMLVVAAIMGLLVGGGVAAYNRFNQQQQLQQAALGMVTALRVVQKRADAGEKPQSGVAGCASLEGYEVQSDGGFTAQIYAVCNDGADRYAVGCIIPGSNSQVNAVQSCVDVVVSDSQTVQFANSFDVLFATVARGVIGAPATVQLQNGTLMQEVTISAAGAIAVVPREP